MSKGKSGSLFIVIEALDAGGSQTQTNLLLRRLKGEGYKTMSLHFPQENRATGRLIYDKFLLQKNKNPFSRREQALLYISDFFTRADEMNEVISGPAKDKIIVSDRFCTSTMAYQTIGLSPMARKKMVAWITWLCYEGKPALPRPDLTIFIDTPVAVSLRRLHGKKLDYFETKSKLTAIRNSYLRLGREQHWVIINGVNSRNIEKTRQTLQAEIWQVLAGVI